VLALKNLFLFNCIASHTHRKEIPRVRSKGVSAFYQAIRTLLFDKWQKNPLMLRLFSPLSPRGFGFLRNLSSILMD
jgi:hypothetical protein